MSESNPALALSYRLGRACLASLLLLPVALIIIVILTVVYNAHDAPPGHDVVFGLAAAPIMLFGFASTVLAIPGASLMYVHGSSARRGSPRHRERDPECPRRLVVCRERLLALTRARADAQRRP